MQVLKLPLSSTPEFRPIGESPFVGKVDQVLVALVRNAAKDIPYRASLTSAPASEWDGGAASKPAAVLVLRSADDRQRVNQRQQRTPQAASPSQQKRMK